MENLRTENLLKNIEAETVAREQWKQKAKLSNTFEGSRVFTALAEACNNRIIAMQKELANK